MQIAATETKHYFNTTREVEPNLSQYIKAAQDNEKVVLEIFRYYPDLLFTPYEVHDIMVKYLGEEHVLITSVRRAITVLTKNGHLEQTEVKKPGPKGRDNLTWKLKSNIKNMKISEKTAFPAVQEETKPVEPIEPVLVIGPVEALADELLVEQNNNVSPLEQAAVGQNQELPFTDAEEVLSTPAEQMSVAAEGVNIVRDEIKQMFAGFNLGDKHEAAMITMAKFFDSTFIMVEKFNQTKGDYTVNDISEAKLKSGVAKAFKKTIADTRIGLSKSVKELENQYKNSIAYETTMIKILSQGFKMFETTFKAMEAELDVSVNFEANYKMKIAQEVKQKRFVEIESLGLMMDVDPVVLSKVETLDDAFYEKFLADAQTKKAEREAIEEQKRKEKEASDLFNSRMRMLNDIHPSDHPIKNKLLLNMAHDDWSLILTEMSNYVTKLREEKERATPPPPPVSALNPFADVPQQAPPPPAQNGGYVPNKNINPNDPFWGTPASVPTQTVPPPPISDSNPFEQVESPFVPPAAVASVPAPAPAPISIADPGNSPVLQAPVASGPPPMQHPISDSPEYIADKAKLNSLIAGLSFPPCSLETPRAYQKYMEIMTKFNGFKAWAVNELSK